MAEPLRHRRRRAQGRGRHQPAPRFLLAIVLPPDRLLFRGPDPDLDRPSARARRIHELGRQHDRDLRLDPRFRHRPAADRTAVHPAVLLPLQRADLPGPDDADRGLADARLRARRRGLGRSPAGRSRPGRGQAGGQPGRHPLAVGRGLRESRRQAGARPAVPRRARDREDDARQGDRDRLQLSLRFDAGVRVPADVHGDGRRDRPLARAKGEEARAQVGRSVHRLHRRDRRGRHAARRARGRSDLVHGRPSRGLAVLRPLRRAESDRRHDPRDARLARPPVRRAREQGRGSQGRPGADLQAGSRPRDDGRRRPAGAEPAARRHGRDRQPALLPAPLHELDEHLPRRDLLHPGARRQVQASRPETEAAQGPDLLHRRYERPARAARSGAYPAGADGPPRLAPDADEGRPPGHLRPVHQQGRPRVGSRRGAEARRAGANHLGLLAGDDRAGVLDGSHLCTRRRTRAVRLRRHPRGDDDRRVRHGGQHRVPGGGHEGSRGPRVRPCRGQPRLHEGLGVHADLDSHARRVARPPPGGRTGRALQPVALGPDGDADLGPRRDGCRTGLLRPDDEWRRRRHPDRDPAGGD